jgi:hypothetical protein
MKKIKKISHIALIHYRIYNFKYFYRIFGAMLVFEIV